MIELLLSLAVAGTPDEPGELAAQVLAALACRPTDEHLCASVDDGLAGVEDTYPESRVLEVSREGRGLRAHVLRTSTHGRGVIFEYHLGADGRVRARQCHDALPTKGQSITAVPRPPDLVDPATGRLIWFDRCSPLDACGSGLRRLSFDVVRGRLESMRDEKDAATRGGAVSEVFHCFSATESLALPDLPITVAGARRGVFQRSPSGRFEGLVPGATVQDGAELILYRGAQTELLVGAVPLRLDADLRPIRIKITLDPSLVPAWRALDAKIDRANAPWSALAWSPPFAWWPGQLFRLEGEEAKLICDNPYGRTIDVPPSSWSMIAPASAGRTTYLAEHGTLKVIECEPPKKERR